MRAKWKDLYDRIRGQISGGQLPPGTRLPSTRDTAEEHGLSRTTVITAFEQLIAEGFLETRPGSGTFVSSVVAGAVLNGEREPWAEPDLAFRGNPSRESLAPSAVPGSDIESGPEPGTQFVTASSSRFANSQHMLAGESAGLIDFRSGRPDLSVFPWARWEKAERSARLKYGVDLLQYQRPEGLPVLRTAIARYLGRSRGLPVDPERLIVCNGTTQAIAILGEIFVSLGQRKIWLEDPLTLEIGLTFRSKGLEVGRIPVDEHGLRTGDLPPDMNGHLVFVTPSHQFPAGSVLSLKRRLELVSRVTSARAWIIEDDYDSEFRFEGPPLATLASLDPDKVVYIGTFSKTLAPGLRTAYIHLPQGLVDIGRSVKWKTDLHNPPLIQAALAEFLDSRFYDLHVRTMRKLYKRKRDLVKATFLRDIPGAELVGSDAGIHAMAVLTHGVVDAAFVKRCRDAGIVIYPVSVHAADPGLPRRDFILGYGHLDFESIREGLARLAKVLR